MRTRIYFNSDKFEPKGTVTVYQYDYKYDHKYYVEKYGTMICPICNSEVLVYTFESQHLKSKKCRKAAE